jgi:translation initiation factor IF-2
MSKKDIIERLNRPAAPAPGRRGDPPPAAPGRPKTDAEVTRVSANVVRRRRGDEPEPPPPPPVSAAPAVVVRRRPRPEEGQGAEAPVVEVAPLVREPEPAARDERPPSPAEPEPAPVVVEVAPVVVEAAPVVVEAPPVVEAAPAPIVEAVAPVAAPVVEVAEARAPTPPAVVAAPPVAPAAVPAARPPESAEPARQRPRVQVVDESPRFRGLGSAVVVPPPGYDPSNPDAYRAQQGRDVAARTAAAAAASANARGGGAQRRRVAESAPAPAAPAQPTWSDGPGASRGRRVRDTGAQLEMAMRNRPRRGRKARPGAGSASPQPKAQKRKIRVDGAISVGQLAHELSLKAPVIIKKLMELGTMATVNEMLDAETASLVAGEFDYEIENVAFNESEFLQHVAVEETEEGRDSRPPVVTIMGHVDHGKTTLLDSIRKAKVAAGEAGGITQHIGAYQVERNGHTITFLDTPGHAAFTAMRARGASLTDIVVLVVAADDGVQPQTQEAIRHAQAAEVPIVVAINKIDKPGVNPDAIKQRLGEYGLVPEEWGGETLFAEVSALKGIGIDELLETILLQAEVMELNANPERHAEGVVLEAKVERGRGPVASLLVQEGTLKVGEHVVIGSAFGKVRAMMDHRGKPVMKAGPSSPVEIFGLSDLPNVGDRFAVVASEKNARTLAEHRSDKDREAALLNTRRRTVDDLRRIAGAEELKTLFVVLKSDVQGSLEALKYAINEIQVDGCAVRVLHDGVGAISESDVSLVAANDGLLIGFNVKLDPRARRVADEMGVKPELYSIIYDVLDRITGALTGMLEPVYEQSFQGRAEVRAVFNISKVGTIAGCMVTDGKIGRSSSARLLRDGREIWKGDIGTLKRFKDDAREVASGYECGIGLEGMNDVQMGDIIEAFATVRVDRPASSSH